MYNLPENIVLVTGWGKHSREVGTCEVKDAVVEFLDAMDSPFHVPEDNPGRMVARHTDVEDWIRDLSTPIHVSCQNFCKDKARPQPLLSEQSSSQDASAT